MRKFITGIFQKTTEYRPTPPSREIKPEAQSSTYAKIPFPDGIEVLHNCTDATVDICFVHGLTGNRDTTWTAKGQDKPWPETLLSPKLKRARILTYGYDAYVVCKSVASSNRLLDHSTNLLHDLTTDRFEANASSRPIIFVAHSLGGLVCKETILQSRFNPESHLKNIFNCVIGVIFMGTPHTGSWIADWARIPAAGLGILKSTNTMLLDILETDNQFLESIQLKFLAMLLDQRPRIQVSCFFEELPLLGVGKVVSKDSATFPGYSSLSIHANHSNMAKFANENEAGFKRVLGELRRWEGAVALTSQLVFQEASRTLNLNKETQREPSITDEAAPSGDEAVLRLLIENGANVEAKDENGATALHRAASKGHKELVRLLLEKGADTKSKDKHGQTALHWAALEGPKEVVQLLLDNGADIQAQDKNGEAPLGWAAWNNNVATVQLLLENGAEIEARNNNGKPALYWAVAKGFEAAARLLLEKGADIEPKDNDGNTVLY